MAKSQKLVSANIAGVWAQICKMLYDILSVCLVYLAQYLVGVWIIYQPTYGLKHIEMTAPALLLPFYGHCREKEILLHEWVDEKGL